MPDVVARTETAAASSTSRVDRSQAPTALWIEERSIFMRNTVACPACRLHQTATGRKSAERLHVRITGTEMVVTEADDLHRPGRSIRCERILSFPGSLIFQITAFHTAPGTPREHSAGMAFLSRHKRRWKLKVFGHADGVEASHDCLFDAVEEV